MDPIFSKYNNSDPGYLAIFDLDRTLIGKISGKALMRHAWKKRLISFTDLMNAVYLYLLYKLRFRASLSIIDEMIEWVKGKPESLLEDLCSEVCTETLLPSLFSEAIAEINFHKERDAKVIILSSALKQICRHVSEFIGMDGFISTSLEVKDGYLTGKSEGRVCFGEEKLSRLLEYCKDNTINIEESWYYGDSLSDLPVLMIVSNPVCVNPDRELKKEARKRGWRILVWKN